MFVSLIIETRQVKRTHCYLEATLDTALQNNHNTEKPNNEKTEFPVVRLNRKNLQNNSLQITLTLSTNPHKRKTHLNQIQDRTGPSVGNYNEDFLYLWYKKKSNCSLCTTWRKPQNSAKKKPHLQNKIWYQSPGWHNTKTNTDNDIMMTISKQKSEKNKKLHPIKIAKHRKLWWMCTHKTKQQNPTQCKTKKKHSN